MARCWSWEQAEAVNAIVEDTTQCKFEATSPASDEVVLFNILQVIGSGNSNGAAFRDDATAAAADDDDNDDVVQSGLKHKCIWGRRCEDCGGV